MTDNDEFISSPQDKFVKDAGSQALEIPHKRSSVEDEEISLTRANSQGRADNVGQDMLILWNFDVAKSRVKDEHKNSIKKWLEIPMLMNPKFSELSFNIIGYASSSGSAEENLKLSKERADAISRYLKEIGFLKVTADGKGALNFNDRGTGGEAMAKNRRVEIRKTGPMPKAGSDAAPDLGMGNLESSNKWRESPKVPNYPEGVGFDWDVNDLSMGPYPLRDISVSINLTGTLKIRIKNPGAEKIFLGTLNQDPTLAGVLEQKVGNDLLARFTMTPPTDRNEKTGVVRATLKFEGNTPLKPEVGIQTRERFIYLKFTVAETPMGPVLIKGKECLLAFTGTIRFDIGPNEHLIRKFSRFVAPRIVSVAAPAAAAAGVILVAAAIQSSVIYGIKWAKEEGIRKCQILAARDGYASRVALEISRTGSSTELNERIGEWKRFEDKTVGPFAIDGYNKAKTQITSIKKDQYDQKIKELKSRYAVKSDGSEDATFTSVRERIFLKLGGSDDVIHNDLDLSML